MDIYFIYCYYCYINYYNYLKNSGSLYREYVGEDFYDNQSLIDEVGDVYTMMEIMHEFDIISWKDIEKRVEEKRLKLSKWSDLVSEEE